MNKINLIRYKQLMEIMKNKIMNKQLNYTQNNWNNNK